MDDLLGIFDEEEDAVLSQIRISEGIDVSPHSPGGSGSCDLKSTEKKPLSPSNVVLKRSVEKSIDGDDHYPHEEIRKKLKFQKTIRKFPGPAGILPSLNRQQLKGLNFSDSQFSQNVSMLIKENSEWKSSKGIENSKLHAPKQSIHFDRQSLLSGRPWSFLKHQLDIDTNDPSNAPGQMTIKWIKKNVLRHTISTKVPFLAAVVLEDPEPSDSKDKLKTSSLKICDSTGIILVVMDPEFISQNRNFLVSGSAIAFVNLGILRLKRKLILTASSKNIISIISYRRDSSDQIIQESQSSYFSTSTPHEADASHVSIISPSSVTFDPAFILQEFSRISNLSSRTPKKTSPSHVINPNPDSLFPEAQKSIQAKFTDESGNFNDAEDIEFEDEMLRFLEESM